MTKIDNQLRSSEDKSDRRSISRHGDVFSDDYFYGTYKESVESCDNDEI